MVNPYHNGGQCDYTPVVGGGQYGCTDRALLEGLVHKDVTFYSWAYGHTNTTSQWDSSGYTDWRKISNAPELFGAQDNSNGTHPSYPWIASPLGDPLNIKWWAQSVQRAMKQGGRALGFVDTSWISAPAPKDFGDLKTLSECAWNIENCLADSSGLLDLLP